MQARRYRKLKSGKKYNNLFPQAKMKKTVLDNVIDANKTVKSIKSIILQTLPQTRKIAKVLKRKTIKETCEAIFDFVYDHVQYERDTPGYEELHTPARIWAKRKYGVDCDDYTIIISSILYNLGIPHRLRMTKYKRDWQHIYVVVPHKLHPKGYFTIDPVVDSFDYEVPFSGKSDTIMTPKIKTNLEGLGQVRQHYRPQRIQQMNYDISL